MRNILLLVTLLTGLAVKNSSGETSLTIYNQDFAINGDTLKLNLQEGVNEVRYADVALFAEASSVILRDPTGKTNLQILEQAFRG